MNAAAPSELVDVFLDHALTGDAKRAAGLAVELYDHGASEESVITDLLAAAQHQIGERWQRNELSIAEEHLATGASETALYALSDAAATPDSNGRIVVCCAEGDWHAIAAHMFAERLRAQGFIVAFLGASTPADDVAKFVERRQPDALAITCSLPLFYSGVTRVADAAHRFGVPVLAGGRALERGPARARRLGADGWGSNIYDAISQLTQWRASPPPIRNEPTVLHRGAVELEARAPELADSAFDDLARRFPAMSNYDTRQLTRTREDMVFIARFVAAAQLVDDDTVLTEFLDWLAELLEARGVPRAALTAGLEALQPLFDQIDETSNFGEIGLQHLANA